MSVMAIFCHLEAGHRTVQGILTPPAGRDMAIWQYRLTLLPEEMLLRKYDLLPPAIPMELAEEFDWWSETQPPSGLEQQINLILPQMDSWSTKMRMWGRKHSDDAHVIYEDDSKTKVIEISFRIDARSLSLDLVRRICTLTNQLKCVLLAAEYKILLPDESMVVAAINDSTAKRFVEDPETTLRGLDQKKIQEGFDYMSRNWKKNPPE
jgi:hypothetical protein